MQETAELLTFQRRGKETFGQTDKETKEASWKEETMAKMRFPVTKKKPFFFEELTP